MMPTEDCQHCESIQLHKPRHCELASAASERGNPGKMLGNEKNHPVTVGLIKQRSTYITRILTPGFLRKLAITGAHRD